MMESCFNDKVARAESIVVEDLRRDLNFDLREIAGVQDSSSLDKEFLQVYLRIRPFSQAELEHGESQDCVTIQPPDTVLLKAPRSSLSSRTSDKTVPQTAQRFQFSKVFGSDISQMELFEGTAKGLVKDVLEGRNSLVFTYGVTNAGKTFTFLGPEHDAGVLPRAVIMIFSSLEGRILTQMSVKPQRCLEVLKLTEEQQVEENLSKRNLLRLLKENDAQKSSSSSLSSAKSEGSDLSSSDVSVNVNSISLDMELHTKFSVWVSFCEIYNENIFDLLEPPNSLTARRANLRLCQDIKGNSFIKDLRWVQVSSADEAFKVMRIGKKNQSISSTKLNQLSSRSHSIFSVRILRIEDVGTLRVKSVSELSLCDLAGSERCGKTQNKGDRLKEAGNINTSLLSLGKCINALKGNQQARHHVPFRESKLTHYLQGFFTGRGKIAMIVNINQCASMYDETINVLKFSAVAQKVVVLSTLSALPLVVKKSAREVSFIINKATQRASRRTSLLRWEDTQEDEVTSEDEEESAVEDTLQESEEDEGKETVLLDKDVYENQLQFLEQLQEQLRLARAEAVTAEGRIRDEVTREFSELFTQMQTDYNERMSTERELLEERCERRLEIFKQLVGKTSEAHRGEEDAASAEVQESECPSLDGMINSMRSDLDEIRKDAEATQLCLVTYETQPSATQRDLEAKVLDLTDQLGESQKELKLKTQELSAQSCLTEELKEIRQSREQRVNELMLMCVEKDEMISKVQAALDQAVEANAKYSIEIKDLLHLHKHATTCSQLQTQSENRKRRQDRAGPEELPGQPPLKKGTLEDSAILEDPEVKGFWEDSAVSEDLVCDSSVTKSETLPEPHRAVRCPKDELIADLQRERQTLEFCIQELKSELERERRAFAETLGETERRIAEEQRREFSCILTRLNAMENKLNTAEATCSQLKTTLESGYRTERSAEELKAMRKEGTALREENKRQAERVRILEEQLVEWRTDQDKLHKVNSDLQAEVKQLEEEKARQEAVLLEKESSGSSNKEADLAKKEAELAALRTEAQEARKKEVERRRELLAVAEEAVAQKDAELEKRQAEINRLKEELESSCEKLKSLSVDVQRRDEETSDLREKLTDSKKQIQQVQREICCLRDGENSLKQKLSNLEKLKSQLKSDLTSRDRTIQQLKTQHSSDSKTEDHVQLYDKALKDLQERQCIIEQMRLVLSEQEETQAQMEVELENRDAQVHQLSQELENLRRMALKQNSGDALRHQNTVCCHAVTRVKEEAARAREDATVASEKHQAERRKWLEEKLVLIAQAKDAEERRNQDIKRYAEDRERLARHNAETESLKARLAEREQEMEGWRRERDALVSALEVQLKKLVSSIAEKDTQIKELKCSNTVPPPGEVDDRIKDLLKERENQIQRLQEQLKETLHTPTTTTDAHTQTVLVEVSVTEQPVGRSNLGNTGRTRASVASQGSCGSGPSVLDSSVISTETGRCSRFPHPELEISFSSLHPERFRLKRPGDDSPITVNVSHAPSARKRKSSDMDRKRGNSRKSVARTGAVPQDGVERENRANARCKKSFSLPAHQEEERSPALGTKSSQVSQSSLRGKKEGKFQKIGDFLNSSPNFLGSKAKRIMGLMSGKSPDEGGSSLNLKRPKRKINISSPMNISANQIISRDAEEKESDSLNIKRRLRTKTPK